MNFFQNSSLRRKQMLVIMTTTSVALFLICAALTVFEIITFRQRMTHDLSTYASIVGNNVAAALDFDDAQAAAETLAALKAEPDIMGSCVYSPDGRLFAKYTRPRTSFALPKKILNEGLIFNHRSVSLFQPIKSNGQIIGIIYLESDTAAVRSQLAQYAMISGIVLIVTFFISFLLSSRLQRVISEPLLDLVKTSRDVAQNRNYSIRVQQRSGDEIGILIDGFNAMLAQIQERDATLEQRVKERTHELAQSLSILNATLDSTADGIFVVNTERQKILQNRQVAEIWKLPKQNGEEMTIKDRLEWVANLTNDPQAFIAKVEQLYSDPDARALDEFEFKDGTVVERITGPVRGNDGKIYGRIWTFRDITERKRMDRELLESQALFHSLVEQMPAGVFRKDAAGRYVLVNSWFCQLCGIRPGNILGKTASEVAAAEAKEHKAASLNSGADHHKEIMRTGKALPPVEEQHEVNGQIRYVQAIKTPVFGADGTLVGSQGVLVDITERKSAEAALAYEQYLLTSLMDNFDDRIYFKDIQSRFIRCSASMAKRFGVPNPESLIGKTDSDYFTDEHALQALADEQKIIATGVPLIGTVEKETWPDGHVTWAMTTKMPFRDKNGKITGTFGVSKDMTAIKEAEAKLEQAHRDLMDASRQAGMAEVATSVLHNVGNVLNSANVSTSLIADKVRGSRVSAVGKAVALMREHENDLGNFFANDPKGKKLIDYLAQLAGHLEQEKEAVLHEINSLVNNIIHIKEIVAMQQGYSRAAGILELVKPTDLVEDALRMNTGAMTRHNINVIREFNDVPAITTDKHKVLQILVNLIRNAKYACDDSGRTDKKITLKVWNGDGRVKISVVDNGIGIPAENLTRIFNHGFTTRKEGHGFGLHSGAIAAQELGGALTASSDGIGRGAKFTLELPFHR